MENILEQLINMFKPKAHDAIDKITNLFKSNEEIEFEKFLESVGIYKDSDDANILRNYMEKAGMPYIKSYEDAWPTFKKGKRAKGEPDTLNVRPGNITDFVEELSHAIQYNPRTKEGEYRDRMGSIRDSLRFEARRQAKAYRDLRYKEPGTVEYEAHKVIAPSIWQELGNPLLEEIMAKWEKDAPQPNPSNPRWLSKYLKAE